MGGNAPPGIERALFRNNEGGGRSSLVRPAVGARFSRHAHHGSEEVVAMAGEVRIGGVALAAGDYLYRAGRGTRRGRHDRRGDLRLLAEGGAGYRVAVPMPARSASRRVPRRRRTAWSLRGMPQPRLLRRRIDLSQSRAGDDA
ncbi:MAG: cupin domain-containing protein [Burkholderiaceae bacterium]|nr:cupin domain-containing protein [Burkholderiaceae bacterium]